MTILAQHMMLLPCREMASKVAPYLLRRTADILTKHLPPLTQLVVFCRPSVIQVGCPARPPSVMCRCKQQAEALTAPPHPLFLPAAGPVLPPSPPVLSLFLRRFNRHRCVAGHHHRPEEAVQQPVHPAESSEGQGCAPG